LTKGFIGTIVAAALVLAGEIDELGFVEDDSVVEVIRELFESDSRWKTIYFLSSWLALLIRYVALG